MKSRREIREMQRNIKNMALAGAGAIAMFAYAGYIYFENPGHVIEEYQALESTKPPAFTLPIVEILPEANVAESLPAEVMSKVPSEKAVTGSIVDEIQSFEVSCNNGSLVFNWVTEGQGKYAYEIEKTTDNEHFEVFTRAPQPEKKDGLNHYFVEESVDASELASYRLKRIIGKNKYEYTEPVQVQCQKKPAKEISVDVFPAGFGAFRIIVDTPVEEQFEVVLTDATQTILESKNYPAIKGSNEFVLESEKIIKGTYLLKISSGSMSKEKKVVVK